ncbi:type II toxin-antitoxin system antitoxin SocA domain-containing protein [Bradyrhizobium lablabi]|uniref:Panacea domain-containing protein n=1 Tax=Bradyrhizobium lablabi TaxID=722472 RepID=UPI0018F8C690
MDEQHLLSSDFRACANGPVLTELYARHRGRFKVDASLFGKADNGQLTPDERETVNKVLDFYGDNTAHWLSNLTHQEAPGSTLPAYAYRASFQCNYRAGVPCTNIIRPRWVRRATHAPERRRLPKRSLILPKPNSLRRLMAAISRGSALQIFETAVITSENAG